MSISITVEATAGCSIEEVAKDICELSNKLGILVCCDFNRITMMAYESTPVDVMAKWKRAKGYPFNRNTTKAQKAYQEAFFGHMVD